METPRHDDAAAGPQSALTRMEWLEYSVTNTSPVTGCIARCAGRLNSADAPRPSAVPTTPGEPASGTTTGAAFALRGAVAGVSVADVDSVAVPPLPTPPRSDELLPLRVWPGVDRIAAGVRGPSLAE